MLITKILRSRKDTKSYALYIDEAYAFDVSEEVFAKFALAVGKRIDDKTVELISSAEAQYRARGIALNFISYRPRSSREVIHKLLSKGFSSNLAKQIVQKLQMINLIDDREFARMYLRDKMLLRPMGRALVRHRLLEKGVPPNIVERVLREQFSDKDEYDAALALAAKKIKVSGERFSKLETERRRKKIFDYLMNRGFSSEIASKTLRSLFP
ncbi:MAG: RecX family transcriptional regulator [bacterium]